MILGLSAKSFDLSRQSLIKAASTSDTSIFRNNHLCCFRVPSINRAEWMDLLVGTVLPLVKPQGLLIGPNPSLF